MALVKHHFFLLFALILVLVLSDSHLAMAATFQPEWQSLKHVPYSFWILGGLAFFFAVATVTRRNPMVAALCLVATLISSAGIYVLLHATFLAAIQVLVYAGAIMVLFVFVVLSVNRPDAEEYGLLRGTFSKILGVYFVGVAFFMLANRLLQERYEEAHPVATAFGTVEDMGKWLFRDHLFPFEALSILLIVSIVGAVIVSRRSQES